MKTRIISFLLLFISCNALQAQLKIIGGSAVDITQRPYQAAIFVNGQFNGGGVILNNQWILTAAQSCTVTQPLPFPLVPDIRILIMTPITVA